MNRGKTVLVVDDEPNIVEILKSYLEKAGYGVACAFDGNEALSLFAECRPALVLLDLMLPGRSGEEVCKEIREKSRVPVIMLTAKSGEESLLEGLSLGADDYVVKPFSPRELLARIEAVLRRAGAEPAPLVSLLSFGGGELLIDGAKREVRKNGRSVLLTPNEFGILLALAKHPAKTFTREELIASVLGMDYEGFDRVIDTHVKNLRQKLGENPKNPKYIKTVHGVGYAFGGDEG
jgi:DNA-binding response OmpR family regulator